MKNEKISVQLLKEAVELHRSGNLLNAERLYLDAIEKGLDHEVAFLNLAVIYKNSERKMKAIEMNEKALSINPKCTIAYSNLGNLQRELGNLDQALTHTLKSLELDPDNRLGYLTLGVIYRDLGKFEQAIEVMLKSLKYKQDDPVAYLNLGILYKDLCDFNRAISFTLKSLELRPKNTDAYMNLGWIHEIKRDNLQALEFYLKAFRTSMNENVKRNDCFTSYLTTLVQLGRIVEAKKEIHLIQDLTLKTDSNIANYPDYLSSLIPMIPELSHSQLPESIHIGDSQSLAFTNQKICVNSINSVIKPSLVKGAKAWHLSKEKSNVYKTCFLNTLRGKLNKYKFILLSFGEIDCLPNEGILKYCAKYNASIEKTSKLTAKAYVRWVASELSEYREKLIIFGTPAPQRQERTDEIDWDEQNSNQILMRFNFNQSLASETSAWGFRFANVFKMTADENGFNNNKWLIDNFHLHPEAIHEIIAHHLI